MPSSFVKSISIIIFIGYTCAMTMFYNTILLQISLINRSVSTKGLM
jgi:hypothetical protein